MTGKNERMVLASVSDGLWLIKDTMVFSDLGLQFPIYTSLYKIKIQLV